MLQQIDKSNIHDVVSFSTWNSGEDCRGYGRKDRQNTTTSIDETIKPDDIDRLHRLGKPKSSKIAKPPPTIVNFVRCNTFNRIYRNKKKLKGTGISMTEILTAKRINMLEKEHTFNNV